MGQAANPAGPRRPRLRVITGGRATGEPPGARRATALAVSLAVFCAVLAGGLAGPALLRGLEPERLSEGARSYYPDCAAAHADAVFSIPIGAPAYRRALDADADGIACEPWPERKSPLD